MPRRSLKQQVFEAFRNSTERLLSGTRSRTIPFALSAHARQCLANGGRMSQVSKSVPENEMRPEYDIRGGVRGKYYERYHAGTNVVLLERDLAEVFRDSESVNRALRLLVNVAQASASSRERRGLPSSHPGRVKTRRVIKRSGTGRSAR
jgi:hypothetical protein